MIHKIVITIIFCFLLLAVPVYAEDDFQYSKQIQTDNSPGYKYVVLDKEVYAHSNQLQDLRIFDETNTEVPYFLDSIHDATTSIEKESFIQSELACFVITQDRNDTVITIEVNHLFAFHLELNTDDIFERNYGLYGINSESKRYLLEGTLSNSLLVPSLTNRKDMVWSDNSPVDQLQLVIHNRDNKPINLKSMKISYYINKLVFKDLGNTHYRLTYGNTATSPPRYDIMDYKTTIKKGSLAQAMLGTEVSIPPKSQLPENPTPNRLLFYLTISALALLLIAGVGSSLRTKHLK